MRTGTGAIAVALAAIVSMAPLAPQAAQADSRQKNKNMWRNIGIGAGAIALHGLINHNGTEALVGAAGAAYSANRYEQDRHSQSRSNSWRQRYHRRYGYYPSYYGQYNSRTNAYGQYNYRTNAYGQYPNVEYFNRNGHTYARDRDTGQTYLWRW